jgi:NADH-quinone oxidoreductase subunit N
MFALLLRYFALVEVTAYSSLVVVFAAVAIASMVFGNLLALRQNNVKRLLAYSSIAQLGYLLVAFLAAGTYRTVAVGFFLASYFATMLGAFAIVGLLSGPARDAEDLEDYRGLYWRRPWLATAFTAVLLSLAGIPLTAGFIGKFYVLLAGVGSALWYLVIILVVTSILGLYFYLRVVVAMYAQPEEARRPAVSPAPRGVLGHVALAGLIGVVVWLGVYPAPLIELIRTLTQ